MHYLHHSATAFAAIVAGVIASSNVQAGSRVGGMTAVVHDVASSVSGQAWAKKAAGDNVSEDEFIRTEMESTAQISFIDETDIRMGPAARMKIDRVVFKSGRAVAELTVTAEAGAMRWNSGVSQSEAYLIKTQTVIIKVRGTTFDLFAEPQQTTVVLRRGSIEVCAIDAPQRCQTLSRPGDTVVGTPNDLARRAGPGASEFADRCLSARAMAPCAILASVQPTRPASVEPTRPGSAQPTRSGSVVPSSVPNSVPSSVPPDRGRGHVVYGPQNDPSGPPKNPTPKGPDYPTPKGPGSQATPTPSKPDCYRNRRACQASPKPGRPDTKPYVPKQAPYVPKQKPIKVVTQKPTYTTQAVKAYAQPRQTMQVRQTVQPRQTMMRMRPVYRPPPAFTPR
jgi:FecR protein